MNGCEDATCIGVLTVSQQFYCLCVWSPFLGLQMTTVIAGMLSTSGVSTDPRGFTGAVTKICVIKLAHGEYQDSTEQNQCCHLHLVAEKNLLSSFRTQNCRCCSRRANILLVRYSRRDKCTHQCSTAPYTQLKMREALPTRLKSQCHRTEVSMPVPSMPRGTHCACTRSPDVCQLKCNYDPQTANCEACPPSCSFFVIAKLEAQFGLLRLLLLGGV